MTKDNTHGGVSGAQPVTHAGPDDVGGGKGGQYGSGGEGRYVQRGPYYNAPTPWRIGYERGELAIVVDADNHTVFISGRDEAERIVIAVNSHEAARTLVPSSRMPSIGSIPAIVVAPRAVAAASVTVMANPAH